MNPTFDSLDLTRFYPYTAVNIAGVVFLFMGVIFGLLIFRQAIQMTNVLPTVLSPVVKVFAAIYVIVAVVAFVLGLGIVISSF